MSILSPSDFTGVHKISQDQYTVKPLQEYIDREEKALLCKLLGDSLADQVISYFESNKDPDDPLLNRIIDPFCKNIQGTSEVLYYHFYHYYYWSYFPNRCKSKTFLSRGIEEYLKGFIYYEFITQSPIKQTPAGSSESAYSSATKVPTKKNYRVAEMRRNEALGTYEAIQYIICENISDYPDFNGVDEGPVFQDIL